MNRVTWELKRLRWRVGNFGLLAVLMIIVAIAIGLMEIRPLRAVLASREADLDARAAKLSQPPPPMPDEAVANSSPDERFGVFLHSFHAMAAGSGLTIPQVSYSPAAQDDPGVRRYLVESTFTSEYPQLRAFIGNLRGQQGVRIEHLTITRPNIGATQLEVRIQCSYLVETGK